MRDAVAERQVLAFAALDVAAAPLEDARALAWAGRVVVRQAEPLGVVRLVAAVDGAEPRWACRDRVEGLAAPGLLVVGATQGAAALGSSAVGEGAQLGGGHRLASPSAAALRAAR